MNAETQGGTAVTELVNKFNASQTEVEVKPVFNSGMYQGLMQNLQSKAAAGGAMPALVQVGWSYREYFANNYQFAEPTKIIKDHFPGDADFLSKKFLPNVLDLAKGNDGKQVGTPYSLSVPIIYANKDILDAAGVDPASLTTWEKVGAAADTIRTKVDGKKGLYIAEAADAWNIQQMLESNGGSHAREREGGLRESRRNRDDDLLPESDQVRQRPACEVGPGPAGRRGRHRGLAHMTIAQRANVTKNGNFTSVGIPAPAFEGKTLNVPAGGSMLSITSDKADQQKAAWTFMKFLYEPANVATWTRGTGYVPETTDAANDAELGKLLSEDSMFKAANSTIKSLVPWTPLARHLGPAGRADRARHARPSARWGGRRSFHDEDVPGQGQCRHQVTSRWGGRRVGPPRTGRRGSRPYSRKGEVVGEQPLRWEGALPRAGRGGIPCPLRALAGCLHAVPVLLRLEHGLAENDLRRVRQLRHRAQ